MNPIEGGGERERKGNKLSIIIFHASPHHLCSLYDSYDHRSLGADEHEKEELANVVTTFLNVTGALLFVIDDYVPWLSFFTTKSWHSKVEDLFIVLETVLAKVFEVEQHRQQAVQRLSQAKGPDSEEYVPDFVDMLLTESLDDGKPLTNKHLVLNLLVRRTCTLGLPISFLFFF